MNGLTVDPTTHSLEDCLTDTEKGWLDEYRKNFPCFCYSLNNDPFKMPVHSNSHIFMGTITRKRFMLWPGKHHRAFTPRELLMLQGYPTLECAKIFGERTSWDVNMGRSRHAMTEQGGNAMHVHVIGLAILYSFLFCRAATRAPEDIQGAMACSSFISRVVGLQKRLSDSSASDTSSPFKAPRTLRPQRSV
eukprot:5987692-Pyramimonas_sp.AAC.1